MPKDQPDFYPLSPMQEGILFHVMENPGTDMYLDQVGYPIAGSLDVAAFEKAWLYVIDRHAALRTSFLTPKNTPPIQVVHQKSAIAVKTLDWRQMSPAQQEEELAAFLASDRAASFDIGSGPLMRLTLIVRADSLFYFNWTWHHILMDGWSSSIVISEVTAAYQAYAKNEAPNFKPARPYREFIRWLTTRDLRGAEDYWRQLLSGANRARSFPLSDFEIETEGGHLQGDGAIRLTAEFTEKLDKYARSNRVTLNSVVQFAWAVLLGAYTNNDDVIFGSVVSGRPASLAGVEAMVGLFINTLPVRLKLTQSTNVMNAIRDLQSQQVRSREYDYTPLVKIQKCSDVPAGSALFDTIIAFENFAGGVTPPQRAEGNQLTIAANRNSDHVNYPVSVVVVPGAELIIHICYDASRFSRSFVDRLLSHFQVLLQTVASSKGGTVKDLSLHGEPELQPRRSWLNHPDQGESQVHVSQMILAAAEGRPSAVAWVSGGKRISYGQLAKDCLHLAGRLRAAGAGPSSSVGVHLHRVEDRVLAILALLVFGAPLREEVRPTGNGSSEKDSEPDIWIVDTPGGGLRTLKPCINLRTLDSPEGDLGDWASLPLDPQALVCSSPLPQRKPITSQLICQRIGFLQSNIGLNQNDVVLHRCSSSFDLFVKEVLWPLTRGAQVVLCEDADLRQVRQRVVEDRVTVLTGPESELAFWLDPEQLGSDSDRPVRMMLCTGEPLSKAAARKLSGPHAIEVWVGFTPPETATEAALEVYSSGVRRRVSTTVDLQLLDKWHRLVPADVPGDVYIVASGNAPSFSGDSHDSIPLQHPLLAGSEQLQPTGDVGAIREDGSLRLLDGPGRCWIDGIAIDLPAIEAILLKHGAVVDCAVRAVTDDQHRRRLVAFCAFQEPAAAAKVERQIRETLAPEKLPAIVPVMRIPRLRDGSVDESELAYVPIVSTTLAREVAAQLRTDPACASLATLHLQDVQMQKAELVGAGTLTPEMIPGITPGAREALLHLPSFCRVRAAAAASPDSRIEVEVWLPAANWNGKLRGLGNGGFAGEIDYLSLAFALSEGYAAAATDTGHTGSQLEAAWALGHREKVADFGYRGIHEMTLTAKAVAEAYYRHRVAHSYFVGCSDGGREGLMEAQRFPSDYNGILAGAPANNWVHMFTNALNTLQSFARNPATYIPSSKLPAISNAVIKACDANDGVADGILEDPRQCHFDPTVLLCTGTETDACLTSFQVQGLRSLYAGTRDSNGNAIFPGYVPGGEEGPGGWAAWITGSTSGHSLMGAFTQGYFTDMVYENPSLDLGTLDVNQALRAAEEKTGAQLDAINPDLEAFLASGGKLILYHGWSDPAISPLNTINYFKAMQTAIGEQKQQASVRLFMVPGMQHCTGGRGADSFGQSSLHSSAEPDGPDSDITLALEQWVEQSKAPEQVNATKYVDEGAAKQASYTRPICAYPRVARLKEGGDAKHPAGYACVSPSR